MEDRKQSKEHYFLKFLSWKKLMSLQTKESHQVLSPLFLNASTLRGETGCPEIFNHHEPQPLPPSFQEQDQWYQDIKLPVFWAQYLRQHVKSTSPKFLFLSTQQMVAAIIIITIIIIHAYGFKYPLTRLLMTVRYKPQPRSLTWVSDMYLTRYLTFPLGCQIEILNLT